MIIDSHQHVFWHGRDDAGLVADMDEHGIDQAWLLSWKIPPSEDAPVYRRVLNPIHMRPDGTHRGIPLSDLMRSTDLSLDEVAHQCGFRSQPNLRHVPQSDGRTPGPVPAEALTPRRHHERVIGVAAVSCHRDPAAPATRVRESRLR